MFYLNLWKMIFKKHFISKIVFALLFIGLIPGMSALKLVKNVTQENPYFHVLYNKSETAIDFSEKLSNIPGVVEISQIPGRKIKEQIRSNLSQEAVSLINELDFDYSGVTVSISNNLKGKAKKLLKQYIRKIAGDDVEVSQVFQPKEQEMSQLGFLARIEVQLGILLFLWLVMSFIFSKQERNFLYLSHHFNRGRGIRLKTYLFNYFSYATLFGLSFYLIHSMNFQKELMAFLILAFLIGFLPYSKSLKWQN
jgi:hypothetical protein